MVVQFSDGGPDSNDDIPFNEPAHSVPIRIIQW